MPEFSAYKLLSSQIAVLHSGHYLEGHAILLSGDVTTDVSCVFHLGLGGLFPNFHLLRYSHIPENTLYYSLNFPLLFPIIPEELVQLSNKAIAKIVQQRSYTNNIQVSQQLYCIITEPST